MKKMTWKTACTMSLVLGLMVVSQAAGQVGQDEAKSALEGREAGQQKICLASKVTEMSVKDESNQPIGQVQDLVIDATGQVQYLAIDLQAEGEGTEAKNPLQPREEAKKPRQPRGAAKERRGKARGAHDNAKLTLVPFEAAQFHEGEIASQNYVSLKNIDKDRLTQAPTFTAQQLTSQQQKQWMAQVDKFFDRQKSGAARPDLDDKDDKKEENPNREE